MTWQEFARQDPELAALGEEGKNSNTGIGKLAKTPAPPPRRQPPQPSMPGLTW